MARSHRQPEKTFLLPSGQVSHSMNIQYLCMIHRRGTLQTLLHSKGQATEYVKLQEFMEWVMHDVWIETSLAYSISKSPNFIKYDGRTVHLTAVKCNYSFPIRFFVNCELCKDSWKPLSLLHLSLKYSLWQHSIIQLLWPNIPFFFICIEISEL